jgi:translation initiation factor IF-2
MPSKKSLKKRFTKTPIVAVLGHIDHGKTSLLDKIRQTHLAAKEAAGITQHIGAYQVNHKGRPITFIDTPGHAAFSQMRSRGAKVADLVVLVVAADEGFKPQTKESLKHIQKAGISYLVAINKIDLPNVNVNKVKEELAKNGVLVEGQGGEIVAVSVSAKTGQGVNELLEMILLLAEMAELKADPQGKLKAVVIESRIDRCRGAVATVLVDNGSLKTGDEIKVEKVGAKVRAMFDENGKKVAVATPGRAVEVLGFRKPPLIGGEVNRGKVADLKDEWQTTRKTKVTEETEEKKLKIILRSDVAGTLEAILSSLPKEVTVVSSGVGDVTESDVLLATAIGAEIFGFGVKVAKEVEKLAQVEKVKINNYKVIYELLEAIEDRALKLTEEKVAEEILGRAEIIAEFGVKEQRIAGCRVDEGRINKKDKLRLERTGKKIGSCRIKSMKKGKEDVTQAKKGEEFGVIFEPLLDFKIGDMLVSSRQVEE